MSQTLFVVLCVDAEGPLHESLEATFGRIEAMTGQRFEPTHQTLATLQAGAIDLGGRDEALCVALAPQLLAYNDD